VWPPCSSLQVRRSSVPLQEALATLYQAHIAVPDLTLLVSLPLKIPAGASLAVACHNSSEMILGLMPKSITYPNKTRRVYLPRSIVKFQSSSRSFQQNLAVVANSHSSECMTSFAFSKTSVICHIFNELSFLSVLDGVNVFFFFPVRNLRNRVYY